MQQRCSAVVTSSWEYDEVGERRGSSWLLCFVVWPLLGYLLNIMQCHRLCLPPTPTYRTTLQQPWKQVKEKHNLKSWQQMHPRELPRHNAVYKSISISEDFDSICGEQCVFSLTGSVLHLVYLLYFFCTTLVLPRVHSKWVQIWNCLNVELKTLGNIDTNHVKGP